jgi:hypothetical protein
MPSKQPVSALLQLTARDWVTGQDVFLLLTITRLHVRRAIHGFFLGFHALYAVWPAQRVSLR